MKDRPNQPSDADLEAQMRAQAHELDASRTDLDTHEEPARDELQPDPTHNPGQEKSTKTPEPGEASASADDQQQQQQQQQQQPADKEKAAANTQPESEYTKRRKQLEADTARLNRNRQEFEEEKRREREALAREREAAQRERATRERATPDPMPGWSAQELSEAAERFEEAGKYAAADEARARAKEKRAWERQQQQAAAAPTRETGAGGRESAPAGRMTQEQFVAKWKENLDREVGANPDLGKQDTPLYREVSALLKEEPLLSQLADGISKAVKYAKLRLEAGAVPGLKEKVAALEREVSDLRKATSLGGGGAESRGAPKRFEDMTESEQLAHMDREARDYDRQMQATG